jgi:hypothetical protein
MGATQRKSRVQSAPGAGVRPVILTTLATANYLPALAEYRTLELLAAHRGDAQAWLGCVATPAPALPTGIHTYRVPGGMLARSLGNPGNGCIQHGNWLPYLPADDEAVIICIDGDVRMQRAFTAEEWAWLQVWPHGVVGIGPNEPKEGGDTLDNELTRIRPLVSRDELASRFYPDPAKSPPIGNAGCIVATRRTWVQLWMTYLALWPQTAPLFAHIAVQQWTINLAIAREFTRLELPPSFHTHGHWGPRGEPFGGWGLENVATYEGEPILFAHKTW